MTAFTSSLIFWLLLYFQEAITLQEAIGLGVITVGLLLLWSSRGQFDVDGAAGLYSTLS